MTSDQTVRRKRLSCFELKSLTFPLMSLVLRTSDLIEISEELVEKFGPSPDFFDQDLVVLNLSLLKEESSPIDFQKLVSLLLQYKMQPIGVFGGTESQHKQAKAAGLAETPNISVHESMARTAVREQAVAPYQVESATSSTQTLSNSVILSQPLRSGQFHYAANADLIVLNAVSFGADVVADGNIHVYGPLRGRAIAGAKGNPKARIFTTCFEPQLVSIAGIFCTVDFNDSAVPPEVIGKPTQISLVGEKLIMELISTYSQKGP